MILSKIVEIFKSGALDTQNNKLCDLDQTEIDLISTMEEGCICTVKGNQVFKIDWSSDGSYSFVHHDKLSDENAASAKISSTCVSKFGNKLFIVQRENDQITDFKTTKNDPLGFNNAVTLAREKRSVFIACNLAEVFFMSLFYPSIAEIFLVENRGNLNIKEETFEYFMLCCDQNWRPYVSTHLPDDFQKINRIRNYFNIMFQESDFPNIENFFMQCYKKDFSDEEYPVFHMYDYISLYARYTLIWHYFLKQYVSDQFFPLVSKIDTFCIKSFDKEIAIFLKDYLHTKIKQTENKDKFIQLYTNIINEIFENIRRVKFSLESDLCDNIPTMPLGAYYTSFEINIFDSFKDQNGNTLTNILEEIKQEISIILKQVQENKKKALANSLKSMRDLFTKMNNIIEFLNNLYLESHYGRSSAIDTLSEILFDGEEFKKSVIFDLTFSRTYKLAV